MDAIVISQERIPRAQAIPWGCRARTLTHALAVAAGAYLLHAPSKRSADPSRSR